MMHRIAGTIVALLIVGAIAAWWMTLPPSTAAFVLPDHEPHAGAGEQVFWAGGCASCHATPVRGKRAEGNFKLLLGGGLELDTPYGVFRVPNISPHATDGIGDWSMLDFVRAMQQGVSPDGRPYYPSFPYTSYAKMTVEDVMDLKAFLDTLRPVPGRVADHSLAFPWSIQRGINAWQRFYLDSAPVVAFGSMTARVARGRELVEGAGHCGECHTRRNLFGGLDTKRWLGGAPNPEGRGQVPDITPSGKNTGDWSAADIHYYLESGFTPDFDTVGGSMVAVQENLAMLPKSDLEAIAAYLKAVPAAKD
jgi:mono/diheme cytochrome c family protein